MSEATRREAMKFTAAAGAAVLGSALLQSTPALAQKTDEKLTFDNINRGMERAPKARAPKLSSETVSATPRALRSDLCEYYTPVRPILVILSELPLIPETWRAAIKGLIALLDQLCPQ